MRRLIPLAITLLLAFGAMTPVLAAGPVAATLQLPAVDADGYTRPLTADQLTPEERATYAQLPAGGDDARKFLYTRGFLRFCQLVIDHKLDPLDLPRLPARENWKRELLTEQEARNVLDLALGLKREARRYRPGGLL